MQRLKEPAADVAAQTEAERQLATALPLLVSGYEGIKQRRSQIPADAKIRLVEAIERLVEHAKASNSTADLEKWQAERQTYGL